MNKTVTLIEFLESTGAQVRIFDIGRRVSKISSQDFLRFENQQIPYPYPLQQQAWFGLSIIDTELSPEPVIWFLRFPLDETGHLQQAGRDYFIHRMFEASAASQQPDNKELAGDALKDNPHVFKPRDDKMAVFHARLAKILKQPASRFYEHTLEYFSGQQGWEQWNFVGFQGIADLCERLDENDNEQLLINAVAHLPEQPLEAVCQCIENQVISYEISSALLNRCEAELNNASPSTSILAHLLRAISLSKSLNIKNELIRNIMQSPLATDSDILSALAARCWEWLEQTEHASLYLDQLARAGQDTFNACMADLLFMPGMRDQLLSAVRAPERSTQLAEAFSNMLKGVSG